MQEKKLANRDECTEALVHIHEKKNEGITRGIRIVFPINTYLTYEYMASGASRTKMIDQSSRKSRYLSNNEMIITLKAGSSQQGKHRHAYTG